METPTPSEPASGPQLKRFICIHGHFYQPPRENPWLESIERQPSADPYHDWNARVTAECYAPNAAARRLDEHDRILQIVNNYARISFNFGPTLLSWLEDHDRATYEAILSADRESMAHFDGHGSALAQAYNHMILPLAHPRDQRTQIRWGIVDFEHRFGRRPQGMWLPETAVSLETLDILAQEGIQFTILAPHQAARVRRHDQERWQDVDTGTLDSGRAYRLRCPSGAVLSLFFYDGVISRAIAFEGLLADGAALAARLQGDPDDLGPDAALIHVATDGESYGHHHRFGEMALAFALEKVASDPDLDLINYSAFLQRFPARDEVEIHEHTSWSCSHGLGRWREDCGCRIRATPGWDQSWRKPLRETMDWLRDELASGYANRAAELLRDPWAARDDYIQVILDRSRSSLARFFDTHALHELDDAQRTQALGLLEMQRNAMLMFTSCGWFFDDLAGIEAIQVLRYAGRALELGEALLGRDLEVDFEDRLARGRSNEPARGDGRTIFQTQVKPAAVDLSRAAVHHAARSLIEGREKSHRFHIFRIEREAFHRRRFHRAALILGRVRVISDRTRAWQRFEFSVLQQGSYKFEIGLRAYEPDLDLEPLVREIGQEFDSADLEATRALLLSNFGAPIYSPENLLPDERRQVFGALLDPVLDRVQRMYLRLADEQRPLLEHLQSLSIPVPGSLRLAMEAALNRRLEQVLLAPPIQLEAAAPVLDQARQFRAALDADKLAPLLKQALLEMAQAWLDEPYKHATLQALLDGLVLEEALPFRVDLWPIQNIYHRLLFQTTGQNPIEASDPIWQASFATLGEMLHFSPLASLPMSGETSAP